jgi:hypothetical protein
MLTLLKKFCSERHILVYADSGGRRIVSGFMEQLKNGKEVLYLLHRLIALRGVADSSFPATNKRPY